MKVTIDFVPGKEIKIRYRNKTYLYYLDDIYDEKHLDPNDPGNVA